MARANLILTNDIVSNSKTQHDGHWGNASDSKLVDEHARMLTHG